MFRVNRPLHRIKGKLCYLFAGFSCVLLSDPRDPEGYVSVSTEGGVGKVQLCWLVTMRKSSVAVRTSQSHINGIRSVARVGTC